MDHNQEGPKQNSQYFASISKKHHEHKGVDEALKEAQHHVEDNIQEGKLKLAEEGQNSKKQDAMTNMLKKKDIDPFESRYKGFLLNSDRQKSQERYEIFKKIKQEYSKEKTAIVVKNVENKIKQWTEIKLQIDRRRERSDQRKKNIQRQIQERERQLEQKRKQEQAQYKKQALKRRMQVLEKRRQQREQFIKESQLRSKKVKDPKYKEMQLKFKEIEEKLKQERERILEEKKHGQQVKKEEIIEHSKKYEQWLKEKQEERKKKYKVDEQNSSINDIRNFDTYKSHQAEKLEEEKKRQRRKQFHEKVKSMSALPRRDDDSVERSRSKKLSRSRGKDKESMNGSRKRIKRLKHELDQTADAKTLGNQYLRSFRERDNSSLAKSFSLPKINKDILSRPVYKNYLTEAKLHLRKKTANDEIQEVKQNCRSKSEIYTTLSKKSESYENSMIKKIMELGKLNKYDDSIKKESQIDELHAKYIKMRLACIDG